MIRSCCLSPRRAGTCWGTSPMSKTTARSRTLQNSLNVHFPSCGYMGALANCGLARPVISGYSILPEIRPFRTEPAPFGKSCARLRQREIWRRTCDGWRGDWAKSGQTRGTLISAPPIFCRPFRFRGRAVPSYSCPFDCHDDRSIGHLARGRRADCHLLFLRHAVPQFVDGCRPVVRVGPICFILGKKPPVSESHTFGLGHGRRLGVRGRLGFVRQGAQQVALDAGNDAIENIKVCRKHKADWIIKRNLRKESLEDWLEEAQAHGDWEFPREGKEVYTGETWRERDGKLYRVVFEVIQRTITADGQKLLVPEIEVNTWWTSLKLSAKEVIALYHAHGTSEQYHSEIKTDMDLERLPSGKFATNATMLSLGLTGDPNASTYEENQ